MKFDLIVKEPLILLTNFNYEIYEPDSYIELFSLIEKAMYESLKIDFVVEFCNHPLNVFIFGDLSVLLEQLVPIYELLENKSSEYLLDFYECGTDCKFIFKTIDDKQILITDFYDHNSQELISKARLKADIETFVRKVKTITDQLDPSINEFQLLKNWYKIFGC